MRARGHASNELPIGRQRLESGVGRRPHRRLPGPVGRKTLLVNRQGTPNRVSPLVRHPPPPGGRGERNHGRRRAENRL